MAKSNEYKNIDDQITEQFETIPNNNDNEKKFNTLDSYNDDMSKKAVNNLFKGYVDSGGNEKNLVNTSNFNNEENQKVQNAQKKDLTELSKDKKYNSDLEFKGYQYDTAKKDNNHNFRNTNFSTEKIKIEREAREEVKKNKEILKKMESGHSGPYAVKNQPERKPEGKAYVQKPTNVAKKKRNTSLFRILSLIVFLILLIALAVVVFQNNALTQKISELTKTNDSLNTQVNDLSKLEITNQTLTEKIAQLTGGNTDTSSAPPSNSPTTQGNGSIVTPANIPTPSPSANTSNPQTLPTTYTVVAKDNLSKISKKFYGDANKFQKIADANKISVNTNLKLGQKLIIPK